MKKFLKISVLLTAVFLSIGVLVGCGGGGGGTEDDSWKPTGADVAFMQNSTPITTIILFGTPEDISKEAANEFKTMLNATKIGVINVTFSASAMSDSSEVIFGESDRTASIKAKELYNQKKSDAYSWAFYYYDGKLAIYAEDSISYTLAIEDFFDLYFTGTSITFKDSLAECHSMTADEYEKYLDEIEKITIDKNREENAELIPDILKDINKQREELKDNRDFDSRTATENMMSLITDTNWGTAPVNPIDEHPRVMFTKDDIPGIRRALREDTATNQYFFQLLDTPFTGILAPPAPYVAGTSNHNFKAADLEKMLVKALAYQLYDDPYYGYKAIYALKNYLSTMQFNYITSDQYRQFGDVGFTAACIYDWCYDLLTEEDKAQIIAAVENVVFKGSNYKGVKFEIGFPPTLQGSFTGHGSEYQLLRDYLSFSIAIYDENPTWYQYIGARFYNDFVPSRNYYFESTGIASQGTNYLSLRHIATLYSAWLATAGMGANPYNNLLQTMYSFASYEYAPGYIFTDGDGEVVQTTSKLRDAEFMAAYLYNDPTLLALAENILSDGKIDHAIQGLGCTMYTIIRGKRTQPAENPYDNLDLILYNGSPLGQYVVREAWNTTDSAAVFMKLKERHTANHEHGDAGSFQIYYKGMLSSEGGVYDNYNHDHTQKFYKTSISHNTLLIKNHKNTDIYHVGAQRTFTEARTLEVWLNNDYEAGTITGRQHAYTDSSKTAPLYAYLAGDITKAYDSSTVSYVGRRMLTVYTGNEDFPMAFFVYDDISSKNVAFKKTFLLQITSPEEPEVNSKKQTVITENGDGRLVLTCLSDDVTIEKVGGRVYDAKGEYDPEKSKNYLINGRQLVSLSKKDDGHWGRIEISLSGKVDHTFMNVIYVTDKGQTKAAPTIKYINSAGVEGATFGNVAVIFATSRDRITSELKASVKGNGDMSYYISGVAEGKWSVSVGGESIGTFEATKDGGLLTFTAPAGELKITPAK